MCRCLCIVDEFGKGTLTTDGVGLLAASLHHFASMPVPPKLLACTHFSDLLSQPILRRWGRLHLSTVATTFVFLTGIWADVAQVLRILRLLIDDIFGIWPKLPTTGH